MGSSSAPEVPVIDFAGIDPANPGGGRWAAVRDQVMEALEGCGSFEAVYDRVTPEVRAELFGRGMKEVFDLPLELKMKNKSDLQYLGYIGQIPGFDYESLIMDDADTPEGVRRFADVMWPGGNPSFCKTAQSFSKSLSELDQMVRRMILESLGVERDLESHIRSVSYKLRVGEIRAPRAGAEIVFPEHVDPNTLTIICQHQLDGLEVRTKDGDWVCTKPLPHSFTVLLGETIEAWTNGKLQPTPHRVRMSGSEPRNSAIFLVNPMDECAVQAPEELVDNEHPAIFKPFKFSDYFGFRYSEGAQAEHALKAYCGVGGEGVAA